MELTSPMVRNRTGVLHLPLAMALMVAAACVLGSAAIGRLWTSKVRIQLELDACVGKKSLELRNLLQSIETGNTTIRALRLTAGAALAAVQPEIAETAKRGIDVAIAMQTALLGKWRLEQMRWIVSSECRGVGGALPDPQSDLERGPPDLLGGKPLEFRNERKPQYQIHLERSGRSARAHVFFSEERRESDNVRKNDWTASWRTPPTPRS